MTNNCFELKEKDCEKSQCEVADLTEIVCTFHPTNLDPTNRYTSFDYCFHWFQTHKDKGKVADSSMIEQSCLHLMCYLASWGMLRGSSMLLGKSAKFYEPLIRLITGKNIQCSQTGCEIEGVNQEIWNIDVDKYCEDFPKNGSDTTQKGYEIVLDTYKKIKKCLYGKSNTRHIVSVTKIMMGIFGCVPALDRFFCKTFNEICPKNGFASPTTFKNEHLCCIYNFYCSNKNEIDGLQQNIPVLSFDGKQQTLQYSKAKIIDMYGFSKSYQNI